MSISHSSPIMRTTVEESLITIPCQPVGASTTHEDLWREIVVQAKAIRQLKSKWNSLATTSRLPDELLAEVFVQLNLSYRTDQLQWRSVDRYQWIAVCQVCSHWRSVALSTPRLWRDITVTRSMDWMREVLARSCRAPLHVQVGVTDATVEPTRLILRELARIEELLIGVSAETFHILRALDAPAPLLRSLNIEALYQRSPRPAPQLPSLEVLARSVAKLEQLDLLHCPFPWSLPVPFTSLTHLKVVGTGDDRPAMGHIIIVLACLKHLESLDFEGMLPTLPDDATSISSPSTVVSLPRLQRIRLEGAAVECADMLNHLSFPSTVYLTLECTSARGMVALIGCIQARIPVIEQPHTIAFEEDFAESKTHVRLSADDGPISHAAFPLVVTFKCSSTPSTATPAWWNPVIFCSHIPLASVHYVHLSGILPPSYYDDQAHQWLQVFSEMVALEVLSAEGLAAYRVPHILSVALSEGGPPCLQTIRRVELEDVVFGTAETFERGEPGAFTEELVQSLLARLWDVPPLDAITIRRSKYVDSRCVERLEKVVGRVEWDGIVNAEPGDEDYDLNYF